MARFKFIGVETEIDLASFLADERMTRFQEELVRVGTTREDAASLSKSLLTLVCEEWGDDFAESLAVNLREMTRIREQLRSKYEAILNTFDPARPAVTELPRELSPQSFERLFRRLETLMDGIERPKDFIDRMRTAGERFADAERPREEEGVPPMEEMPKIKRAIDTQPRTPSVKKRATEAARDFVMRSFPNPEQWRARAAAPKRRGRAAVGQFERLRRLDPMFAGQGLEPNFSGPGGMNFQPDGLHANPDGSFSFLDYKGSSVNATDEAGYFEGEARRELRSRLERDASIAASLRRGGARCNGWMYLTNNANLADLMRSMAEEIRTSPGGAELFPMIDIVGPGE